MVENKIKSLLRAYKAADDNANRSGSGACVGPYVDLMEDIFSLKAVRSVDVTHTIAAGLEVTTSLSANASTGRISPGEGTFRRELFGENISLPQTCNRNVEETSEGSDLSMSDASSPKICSRSTEQTPVRSQPAVSQASSSQTSDRDGNSPLGKRRQEKRRRSNKSSVLDILKKRKEAQKERFEEYKKLKLEQLELQRRKQKWREDILELLKRRKSD